MFGKSKKQGGPSTGRSLPKSSQQKKKPERPVRKVRYRMGTNLPKSFLLIGLVVLTLVFGTYMVFSASYVGVGDNPPWYYLVRHLVGIVLGTAAGFGTYLLARFKGKGWVYIALAASVVLLFIAYFFGPVIGGSRRWIDLGIMNLQPSELLKVSLILVVAHLLSRKKDPVALVPLAVIAVVFGLVAVENLSSAILIALPAVLMIFVNGVRKRYVGVIAGLGAAGFAGAVILAPYRVARIISYLPVLLNPLKADYQAKQSLYALADGSLFGVGITNSRQKFFRLPEHHTDFIFAIVGEELGFLVSTMIILLLSFIGIVIILIAKETEDRFARLAIFGFGTLFIAQTLLNLAVVTALFPVTGVTLPFISYGNSSLVSMLMIIGFILGFSMPKNRRPHAKKN